jgi:hypothetical protein
VKRRQNKERDFRLSIRMTYNHVGAFMGSNDNISGGLKIVAPCKTKGVHLAIFPNMGLD